MIPLPKFRGRSVGVLGLGPNGQSVVRALKAGGARVYCWDGREELQEEGNLTPPRSWPFENMRAVVMADGNRGGQSGFVVDKATKGGAKVLTDLDLFSIALDDSPHADDVSVVAVTGSAGKSVTVSIISHILAENGYDVAVGGELGEPLMALAEPREKRVYVLELPVRKIANSRELRCDVSVVVNVSNPTGSKEQIELALAAMLKMFKGQGPSDTAIIGVDDILGQKLCTLLRSGRADIAGMGTVIPVSGEASLGHGVFVLDGEAYSANRGKTQPIGDFSRSTAFLGSHFNQDAAAAIAACLTLDVPPQMIIKALCTYRGLVGRFECLGQAGSVLFVDDSFASSPAAAERAMQACPNVFWIGGDAQSGATIYERGQRGGTEINGAYFLRPGDGSRESVRMAMEDAIADAYRDASAYAEEDPETVPVVLFAPGVRAEAVGFTPDAFRSLAAAYLSPSSPTDGDEPKVDPAASDNPFATKDGEDGNLPTLVNELTGGRRNLG